MMIEPNGTALDTMEALQNWVDRFQGMWDFADSFYGSLNFLEAEALADLLAVAHRPDLAALLMQGWDENDPENEEYAEQLHYLLAHYRTLPCISGRPERNGS